MLNYQRVVFFHVLTAPLCGVFHCFFSIQYSGDYPINLYPCVAGLYPPIISHMAMWEIPVNSWFSIVMLNYWRVFVGFHLLNIPFLKGPFCQSLPIECRSYTSTSQWGGWQQNRSSIGVCSCFAPSVAVAKCLCNWVSGPMFFWDTLDDVFLATRVLGQSCFVPKFIWWTSNRFWKEWEYTGQIVTTSHWNDG